MNLITDEGGAFVAGGLEPGRYRIRISHVSYRSPQPRAIDLAAGVTGKIVLRLEPRVYEGSSIVVRAGKKHKSFARTITKSSIEHTPGSFEDPLRVLATQPGMETQSDFDGRISFRGGSPEEAGYSLNGIPVPSVYHLGGMTSIFHPSTVEAINAFAGAHPASLGPGTAGFVDVVTSPDFHPGKRVEKGNPRDGSSGMQGANRSRYRLEASPLTMAGLWRWTDEGKLDGLVSLRRTYHDLVLKALGKDGGYTVPNFFDAQARVDWSSGNGQRFSIELLRSGDRMSMGVGGVSPTGSSNRLSLSGDFSRLALDWKRAGEGAGSWEGGLTLAYQPSEYDMRVEGADRESMDWASRAYILKGVASKRGDYHRFEAGTLLMSRRTSYAVSLARGFWQVWSGPPTEGSLEGDPITIAGKADRNTGYHAVYAEETWYPSAMGLSLTGGLRAEYFAVSGEKHLSPRITLGFDSGSTNFRAAWGLYRSHPLDHPGDPSAISESLRTLRAENFVVGMSRDARRAGLFDVEVYLRSTTGMLSEVAPGVFMNEGEGRAYGIDAEWKRSSRRWAVAAAYSYCRSLQRDAGGTLLRSAVERQDGTYAVSWARSDPAWHPGPHDIRHSLRLQGRVDLGSGFRLLVDWSYRTGRPITPIAEVLRGTDGVAYGVEGSPGGKRLPSYHRLDLRLERSFTTGWGVLRTYAEVANAYDRSNVYQANYDKSYTRVNNYLTLPLLPTIGIAAEF